MLLLKLRCLSAYIEGKEETFSENKVNAASTQKNLIFTTRHIQLIHSSHVIHAYFGGQPSSNISKPVQA